MQGDTTTLSWRLPSPGHNDGPQQSPFSGEGGPTKILKVCFSTNNTLGKNFKLVKCDSSWQIRVRDCLDIETAFQTAIHSLYNALLFEKFPTTGNRVLFGTLPECLS